MPDFRTQISLLFRDQYSSALASAARRIDDITGEVGRMARGADRAGGALAELARDTDRPGSALAEMTRDTDRAGGALAELARDADRPGSALAEMTRDTDRAGGALAELARDTDRPGSALAEMTRDTDRAGGALAELARDADRPGGALAEMKRDADRAGGALAELARDADRPGGALAEMKRDTDRAGGALAELARDADRPGGALAEMKRDTDRAGGALAELARDADRAGGALSELKRDTDRAGGALAEMTRDADRAGRAVDQVGDRSRDSGRESRSATGIMQGAWKGLDILDDISGVIGMIDGLTAGLREMATTAIESSRETEIALGRIASLQTGYDGGASGSMAIAERAIVKERAYQFATGETSIIPISSVEYVARTKEGLSAGLGVDAATALTESSVLLGIAAEGSTSEAANLLRPLYNVMGDKGADPVAEISRLTDQVAATQALYDIPALESLQAAIEDPAPKALELGLSTEVLLAALGAFHQGGVSGSEGGGKFQSVLEEITGGMEALGSSVVKTAEGHLDLPATLQRLRSMDLGDAVQRSEALKVFGEEGASAISLLAGSQFDAFMAGLDRIRGSEGMAARRAAPVAETRAMRLERLRIGNEALRESQADTTAMLDDSQIDTRLALLDSRVSRWNAARPFDFATLTPDLEFSPDSSWDDARDHNRMLAMRALADKFPEVTAQLWGLPAYPEPTASGGATPDAPAEGASNMFDMFGANSFALATAEDVRASNRDLGTRIVGELRNLRADLRDGQRQGRAETRVVVDGDPASDDAFEWPWLSGLGGDGGGA